MKESERYLVMITENNNNKFYHMKPNGGQLNIEYGRIGSSVRTETYDISKFNSKYNEKIKKGYVDKTDLFITNTKSSTTKAIDDSVIRLFIDKLLKFSNDSVLNNYTVNVNTVTQAQIDSAQIILNNIANLSTRRFDIVQVNSLLLDLYHVLPRKMKKVNDHLLTSMDITVLKNKLVVEQDLLDSLASSVSVANQNTNNTNQDQTILDILGIEVNHCTNEQIDQIKNHMGQIKDKFSQAFVVNHKKQSSLFESLPNMKKELLWHGTRNENVISILQKSLMIRPAGAIITGAMFGNACYFANKAIKALGYTSARGSYWARGNNDCGYLFVFEVIVGNQKHIYNHNSSCYKLNEKDLKAEGFDSVYAHGGADLKNDEFMIYNPSKCRIKYIIEIK